MQLMIWVNHLIYLFFYLFPNIIATSYTELCKFILWIYLLGGVKEQRIALWPCQAKGDTSG